MKTLVAFTVILILIASPAPNVRAQSSDPIGAKCMQSKVKAAGKDCLCVHKEWAKAIKNGTLPDLSACEDKLEAALAKAEQKAVAAGGQCFAGETAAEVSQAIVAAVDKTLTQVGRGVLGPAPAGCNLLQGIANYTGGDYSLAPKCVKLKAGETCESEALLDRLGSAAANDFKCPDLCGAEEEGCDPTAVVFGDNVELSGSEDCCLKDDPDDSKKSANVTIWCTNCYTP